MKLTKVIAGLIGLTLAISAQDAFARARMYHAGTGTFMQRDPLGTAVEPAVSRNLSQPQYTERDPTAQYTDGSNLYQYVRSNPVIFVDPTGTRGFVTIYYTGDAAKSFQRAAQTWVSEVKGGTGGYWDANCDYVIEKGVLTEADFYKV